MILKYKSPDGDGSIFESNQFKGERWVFVEGVTALEHGTSGDVSFICVWTKTFVTGLSITLGENCLAFLMNDEGKTIERIP